MPRDAEKWLVMSGAVVVGTFDDEKSALEWMELVRSAQAKGESIFRTPVREWKLLNNIRRKNENY